MMGLFNGQAWWKEDVLRETEVKYDAEHLNFGQHTRDALSKILTDSQRVMNDTAVTHGPRERKAFKELNSALRDAIAAANEIHNAVVTQS